MWLVGCEERQVVCSGHNRRIMDNLKSLWKRLVDFYQPQPQPSAEFYKRWLAEMQKYQADDISAMVVHIETHNNRFPSLNEMLTVADSIQQNRQGVIWQAAKAQEQKNTEEFWSGKKADNYGKQALKLIRSMLEGDMSRQKYLTGMRELGMLEDADDLEAYYAKHTYDLNGRPAGHAMEEAEAL